MFQFADQTRQYLTDAGWTEERRWDESRIKSVLDAVGQPSTTPIVNFLSHFGGLSVSYPHPTPVWYYKTKWITRVLDRLVGPRHFPQSMHDQLTLELRDYGEEYLDHIRPEIGMPVAIVGSYNSDHITILMNESGEVYGDWDEIRYLAPSGEVFIDDICTEAFKLLDKHGLRYVGSSVPRS